MKPETPKYLTEEVLKRCWHENHTIRQEGLIAVPFSADDICMNCGAENKDNLTFTTANEIKLLTDKMKETDSPFGLTLIDHFEVYLAEHFGSSRHIWQEWIKLEPQEQAQLIAEFFLKQNERS